MPDRAGAWFQRKAVINATANTKRTTRNVAAIARYSARRSWRRFQRRLAIAQCLAFRVEFSHDRGRSHISFDAERNFVTPSSGAEIDAPPATCPC